MTPSSRTTGTTVAEGCRPSHMGCGDQPRLWVVVDAITGWEPGERPGCALDTCTSPAPCSARSRSKSRTRSGSCRRPTETETETADVEEPHRKRLASFGGCCAQAEFLLV